MLKVPRIARFQNNLDGSVTLRFPYHAVPVEEVKVHVPGRYRRYDHAGGRAWTIHPPYTAIALELLQRHFRDVIGSDRETPDSCSAKEPELERAYSLLHLRRTAPKVVVDAAYRALARQHHPDLGGDPEIMRRLTEAHGMLSRRLGA